MQDAPSNPVSERPPSQRWARAKSIFCDALELPGDERPAWVKRACGADSQLLMQVESLLADHAEAGSFLQPHGEGEAAGQRFTEGDLLAERFRIVRLLGIGGMGEVYEGEDLTLCERVALKTIRPELAADRLLTTRLRRELQLSRQISHPNVCRVNELWEVRAADGAPLVFFTMELLSGETLSRRLEAAGRLSAGDALPILRQIAAGLTEAHRAGIVHRDLKPGNVFLAKDGRVIVMDFGLALSLSPGSDRSTRTGIVMGTPAYMAPEQFAGRSVTVASDVYAFGVTAFEMLTGRNHPLVSPRSLVPQIPAAWDKTILHCCEAVPEKRPQSVAEVVGALERGERSGHRKAILAGAVVLAAAVCVFLWPARSPRQATQAPPATTKLTFDPGLSTDPTVSRDGKVLLYSSDRGPRGDANIWMQRLDVEGAEARQVTFDPGHENSPTLSPDGKSFAYREERDETIYLQAVSGGAPAPLAKWGQKPHFSPDGAWIAYWTGTTMTNGGGRIWVVSVSGGPPRQVAADFADARLPFWSPDGKRILFWGARSANPAPEDVDWWVVDVASGKSNRVFSWQALQNAKIAVHQSTFVWDHNQIVFAARAGSSTNLWSLPFAADDFHATGPARPLTTAAEFDVAPDVLPDGRIIYSNWRTRSNVWSIAIASGELRQITSGDSTDSKPSVSLNGRTLVYARRTGTTRSVLWKDLATGNEREVLTNQAVTPFVSPDGTMLAYSVADTVRLLRPAENADAVVCTSCGELLGWTPDGREVMVLRSADRPGVDIVNLASKTARRLISNDKVREASLSRGGRLLAISIREKDGVSSRIYLAPVETLALENSWIPVTLAGVWSDKPVWSADDRTLFFSSRQDGFHCIWRQEVNTRSGRLSGAARAVRHFHELRLTPFMLSRMVFGLSADANSLYLNLSSMEGNIWALESSNKPEKTK